MIGTAVILSFLVVGLIALVGLLLYSFDNIDTWNKKRTVATMIHVNIALASLERRMTEGKLRTAEEIDAEIARYTAQLHEQGF